MSQEQDDIDAATVVLESIPSLKVSIVSYITDMLARLEAAASNRTAFNAAVTAARDSVNESANAIIAGTPAAPPVVEPPVEPVPLEPVA